MNTRLILVAAFALSLTSVASRAAAQEVASGVLSDEDVAAIANTIDTFVRANLAGDWAAAAALFTEDAVRMPPNEPVIEGRAAIEAAMAQIESFTDFTATPLEIDGRGGLGYSRISFSITFTIPDMPEPVSDTGKVIVIWRKQADGSWLIAADIWNSDLPLPE